MENLLTKRLSSKRWSSEEDSQLLGMAARGDDWRLVAATLGRSFTSVQARFRLLKNSNDQPRHRSKIETAQADLSCGAMSRVAREIVEILWQEILRHKSQHDWQTPARLREEVFAAIGALVREVMRVHLDSEEGGLRLSFSKVGVDYGGISREAFRYCTIGLEKSNFLVRRVDSVGKLSLIHPAARGGRRVRLIATSKLIDLFEERRIGEANLFTHFPSLQ